MPPEIRAYREDSVRRAWLRQKSRHEASHLLLCLSAAVRRGIPRGLFATSNWVPYGKRLLRASTLRRGWKAGD